MPSSSGFMSLPPELFLMIVPNLSIAEAMRFLSTSPYFYEFEYLRNQILRQAASTELIHRAIMHNHIFFLRSIFSVDSSWARTFRVPHHPLFQPYRNPLCMAVSVHGADAGQALELAVRERDKKKAVALAEVLVREGPGALEHLATLNGGKHSTNSLSLQSPTRTRILYGFCPKAVLLPPALSSRRLQHTTSRVPSVSNSTTGTARHFRLPSTSANSGWPIIFLRRGAKVDERSGRYGRGQTALQRAVSFGAEDVVRYLRSKGADGRLVLGRGRRRRG